MSKHLLIAGTGRSGTSFMVRYLTKLGLETNLSRYGEAAIWHESANAGLEDMPLPIDIDQPYVIKSPFSYQTIHETLRNGKIQFDAVVIPMRDLVEAASSRSILESQAMHGLIPWMADLEQPWEHFGHTPGGIVFSTSPVDQARLLAVGFHQLVNQLVQADIPIILLSFPRLINDADYIYEKLRPVLPATVSPEVARLAHAEVADPGKVRVGAELRGDDDGFQMNGPGSVTIENAAVKRALREARRDLAIVKGQLDSEQLQRAEESRLAAQTLAEVTAERDLCRGTSLILEQNAAASEEEKRLLVAELQAAHAAAAIAAHGREEAMSLVEGMQCRVASLENSTTWRIAVMMQRVAGHLPWLRPLARKLLRP